MAKNTVTVITKAVGVRKPMVRQLVQQGWNTQPGASGRSVGAADVSAFQGHARHVGFHGCRGPMIRGNRASS